MKHPLPRYTPSNPAARALTIEISKHPHGTPEWCALADRIKALK